MQRAQVGEHGENAAVAVLALGHTKLLQDMGAVGLRFRARAGGKARSSSVARFRRFPPKGVAKTAGAPRNGTAAFTPCPKELHMKFRLTRSAYLLALLAAFVVASGAGHKLGTP
jgi:hypothetical protein